MIVRCSWFVDFSMSHGCLSNVHAISPYEINSSCCTSSFPSGRPETNLASRLRFHLFACACAHASSTRPLFLSLLFSPNARDNLFHAEALDRSRIKVVISRKKYGNGWFRSRYLLHRSPMLWPLDHDAPLASLLWENWLRPVRDRIANRLFMNDPTKFLGFAHMSTCPRH